MEKILVTGSSGLLGRSLVSHLKSLNLDVRTFRSSKFNLEEPAQAEHLFRSNSDVDTVFHLAAAVGGIVAHRDNKADYYYRNSMINAVTVHSAHKFCKNLRKIVLVSSACVYPADAPLPLTESDIWGGWPEPNVQIYGLVKRMLEVQARAYKEQYGLNCVVAIPSNSYGPHDNFCTTNSHVIPGIVRKICDAHRQGDDQVKLYGTGTPTRDFIYVDDVSRVLYDLANQDDIGPFNIGSGRETSIREVAETVKYVVGYTGQIVFDPAAPDGQPRKVLNVDKIRKASVAARWLTPLEEGVQRTVDWYMTSNEVRK